MLPTPVSPRPRLVLVEGVAGTGKTTTATTVHRLLVDGGAPARLVLEGDVAHPADHEQVALLDRDGWSALLARHGSAGVAPDVEPLLERVPPGLLPVGGGRGGPGGSDGTGACDDLVLVPYGVLRRERPDLPDALLADVARHDVYEQPADVWRALALHRWRRFAASAAGSPTTWVLDCSFLQNPLTVLLARHDLAVPAAGAHVLAVGELLRPLDPVVLHLHAGDERAALERVRRERPAQWWDHFVGYHTEQEWGRRRGARGVEGTVRLLQERTAVEHDLLTRLPVVWKCLDTAGSRTRTDVRLGQLVTHWLARPSPLRS